MLSETYEIFEIIDIIRIKRADIEIKTNNKACSCLSCRLDGESLFFYNNTVSTIRKGDILYIPKNCSYSQKTQGEEVVCFHLTTYRNFIPQLTFSTNNISDEICALFDDSEILWRQNSNKNYYKCLSNLYKIISLSDFNFSKYTDYSEKKFIENEKLATALEYMSANLFNSQLTVNDVYKTAYMGRTEFNIAFKKIYGSTPRKYIYQERINKAKILLSTGNYTNEEIAFLCGFNDVKYFYVVFKKVTGMSTKQYKDALIAESKESY